MKYVSIDEIVASPLARARLQTYIDEAVRQRCNILDAKAQIKTIRQTVADEMCISPRVFTFICDRYFKDDLNVKEEEADELSKAIQKLMET